MHLNLHYPLHFPPCIRWGHSHASCLSIVKTHGKKELRESPQVGSERGLSSSRILFNFFLSFVICGATFKIVILVIVTSAEYFWSLSNLRNQVITFVSFWTQILSQNRIAKGLSKFENTKILENLSNDSTLGFWCYQKFCIPRPPKPRLFINLGDFLNLCYEIGSVCVDFVLNASFEKPKLFGGSFFFYQRKKKSSWILSLQFCFVLLSENSSK